MTGRAPHRPPMHRPAPPAPPQLWLPGASATAAAAFWRAASALPKSASRSAALVCHKAASSFSSLRRAVSTAFRDSSRAFPSLPDQASVSDSNESIQSSAPGFPIAQSVCCFIPATLPWTRPRHTVCVQINTLRLAPQRLLDCSSCSIETVQGQVNPAQIRISVNPVRFQAKRFTGFCGGLFILPESRVDTAQIAVRHKIPWIKLYPQFIRLISFFQLARG